MRYASIRKMDISDGPGIRVGLYMQGCKHHCKNCFNEETWDPNGGYPFTRQEVDVIKGLLKSPHVRGLSVLGGDPFYWYDNIENIGQDNLYDLIYETKLELHKDIWIWTGYTWEELLNPSRSGGNNLKERSLDLLRFTDVLVDGRYIDEQRNLKLQYAGSENQRVIDVQKSLKKHEVVLYK